MPSPFSQAACKGNCGLLELRAGGFRPPVFTVPKNRRPQSPKGRETPQKGLLDPSGRGSRAFAEEPALCLPEENEDRYGPAALVQRLEGLAHDNARLERIGPHDVAGCRRCGQQVTHLDAPVPGIRPISRPVGFPRQVACCGTVRLQPISRSNALEKPIGRFNADGESLGGCTANTGDLLKDKPIAQAVRIG